MSTPTKSVTVGTIRGGSDARGIGTPGGGALPSRPPGDSPGIGVSTRSRPPHRPGRSSPPHLPRNRSRGRPDLAEVNPYVTSGYNTPGERLAGRRHASGRLVARRPGDRADRLRPLPAGVQPQAGRPGLLLRPRRTSTARWCSTTYGRSTGFCIDPIEKKPLNHFYPGTQRPVVRHGRLQPGLQVLPELGHLEVARDRAAERAGRRPRRSPRRPGSTAAGASRSPTTTRSSGPSTRSTRPGPAARRGSRRWPSRRATSRPRRGGRSTR